MCPARVKSPGKLSCNHDNHSSGWPLSTFSPRTTSGPGCLDCLSLHFLSCKPFWPAVALSLPLSTSLQWNNCVRISQRKSNHSFFPLTQDIWVNIPIQCVHTRMRAHTHTAPSNKLDTGDILSEKWDWERWCELTCECLYYSSDPSSSYPFHTQTSLLPVSNVWDYVNTRR